METRHLKNAEDLEGFTDSLGLFIAKNPRLSIDDVEGSFAWDNIKERIGKWFDNPIGSSLRMIIEDPYEEPDREIYVLIDEGFPISYYIDDNDVRVRYSHRSHKDLIVDYDEKDKFEKVKL